MDKLKEIANYNLKSDSSDLIKKIREILNGINHIELLNLRTREKSRFIEAKFNRTNINLKSEHKLSLKQNDTLDLYGKNEKYHIIIEIDNMRADQVSKKLFSRHLLISENEELIYVSLLYSSKGNRKGDRNECERYIAGHFSNFINRNLNIQYLAFAPSPTY